MLLHAPLLVPSDDAVRGTKPRELAHAAPSAAAPIIRVKEEQQPHQKGTFSAHLVYDGPGPRLPTEAPVLLRAPLLVPSDAALRGTKPREMP